MHPDPRFDRACARAQSDAACCGGGNMHRYVCQGRGSARYCRHARDVAELTIGGRGAHGGRNGALQDGTPMYGDYEAQRCVPPRPPKLRARLWLARSLAHAHARILAHSHERRTRTHARTHARMHARTHRTRTRTHTRAHTHSRAYIRIRTVYRMCSLVSMCSLIRMCSLSNAHARSFVEAV